MLEVRDLHVYYGEIHALKGISFDVSAGEIVTLLGNNGAGKTTTLKTLSGLLTPRRGDVRLDGASLLGAPPHGIVASGITHVPEGRRIFNRLTVVENLEMGAYIRSDRGVAPDMERVFGVFPRLKERRTQIAGTLSGGEQQMLAIGRALMSSPRLLLLDEPSLGLAPLVVGRIGEIITEINRQGTTVLLIEQNTTMALEVASRAVVLDLGQVSLTGTAAELAASTEVRDLYLGRSGERAVAEAAAAAGGATRRRLGTWVP